MQRIKIFISFCLLIVLTLGCGGDKNLADLEFKVLGNCEMCKKDIDGSLREVPGIKKADWNVDTKIMKVTYDSTKISKETIYKKIADAGHDSKYMRASQEAYNHLPECCQYKRE